MKLFHCALICALALLGSQLQAMSHDDQTDLQVNIADFNSACESFSSLAESLTRNLDAERNPARLRSLLSDLNTQKQDLTTGINNTLRRIGQSNMDQKEMNDLCATCYGLLKKLKDIHLVEIQSKIDFLEPSKQRNSNNTDPRRRRAEVLIEEQKRIQEQLDAQRHGGRNSAPRNAGPSGRPPRAAAPRADAPRLPRVRVPHFILPQIPLPRSLSTKAVYHMQAPPLHGFCCAYNALKNACNIEAACGIDNRFAHESVFRNTVMSYLNLRLINPMDGAWNATVDDLAQNVLFLQPGRVLHKEHGAIEILHTGDITVWTNANASRAEKDKALKEAWRSKDRHNFDIIKDRLRASNAENKVVHFFCCVRPQGVDHMILITLIENDSGRGLYIFDNLNYPFTDSSDSKEYINYLCDVFNISEKNRFQGPMI